MSNDDDRDVDRRIVDREMGVHLCVAGYIRTSGYISISLLQPVSRSPSAELALCAVVLSDAAARPYWRSTLFKWTSFAYSVFSFEVTPRFFIFFEGLK